MATHAPPPTIARRCVRLVCWAWLMVLAPNMAVHAEVFVPRDVAAARADVQTALTQRQSAVQAFHSAAAARDKAAAEVARLKKRNAPSEVLEAALRKALSHDERAAKAQRAALVAEADVARTGAKLLSLYDGLLLERRRQLDAQNPNDPARRVAVERYREMSQQRDTVRRSLLPVLNAAQRTDVTMSVSLMPLPDDDVETLLEKADVARDLEDRALRQAVAVQQRIRELEEEASVHSDVSGLVGQSQLFDEEDRRLVVMQREATAAPATRDGNTAPGGGNTPSITPSLLQAPNYTEVEQAYLGPRTDATVANLLSSPTVSLAELQAFEAQLRKTAARLRENSTQLHQEAQRRAREH